MYNLLEYRSNYYTRGSLWFYFKVESTTSNVAIAYRKNNFKSSEYKADLLKETVADRLNFILGNAID